MSRNVKKFAKALGAEIKDPVPEYSAGAFGAAKLARVMQDRLVPSSGKRPGRPTAAGWTKRPKVPMAPETESRLKELARMMSDERRRVSPMQVAGQLLEEATAQYFSGRLPKRS
jgi:hypothetical protein